MILRLNYEKVQKVLDLFRKLIEWHTTEPKKTRKKFIREQGEIFAFSFSSFQIFWSNLLALWAILIFRFLFAGWKHFHFTVSQEK